MPRTPAKKSKKAAASHPPYATMVQEAIKDLKDRTGSSTVAIAKWVESKYTLPDTFKKSLSTALKKMTEDGKLVKVKARSVQAAISICWITPSLPKPIHAQLAERAREMQQVSKPAPTAKVRV